MKEMAVNRSYIYIELESFSFSSVPFSLLSTINISGQLYLLKFKSFLLVVQMIRIETISKQIENITLVGQRKDKGL